MINTPPKIGDIIPFGKYEWLVLDVQADKALIITKDVIEQRAYNEDFDEITWEDCSLRKRLNADFINEFTDEEQARIILSDLDNPNNLWYAGINGGNSTQDKIFLLSIEEADKYFGDSGDYLNKRRKGYNFKTEQFFDDEDGNYFSNSYDEKRTAKYEDNNYWYWLRCPGSNVCFNGGVNVLGVDVPDVYGGVRPAMWVKL